VSTILYSLVVPRPDNSVIVAGRITKEQVDARMRACNQTEELASAAVILEQIRVCTLALAAAAGGVHVDVICGDVDEHGLPIERALP
jgi:hypothetical protein